MSVVVMTKIKQILSTYLQISFEKAVKVNLNERYDEKYVIPQGLMVRIFENFQSEFLIQTIENEYIQLYKTRYWDTNNFDFFTHHCKGKPYRCKVRKRLYTSTDTCFLEVKKKNVGRTVKSRILSNYNFSFSDQESIFLQKQGMATAYLKPVLDVEYKRVILWDTSNEGRITIDFDYTPSHETSSCCFNNIVIIEIKGTRCFINKIRRSMPFPIERYQTSFSKYSMGIIHCYKFSKQHTKNLYPIYRNLIKLNNQTC